ncbi:MAG: SDR family oxidoreductase [Opitutales bacterium]|jgi:NAD(P)-dependent dehydrogenase (short-subunit alcohol dehydrogenase family)|nr:SDR family oxidoreductase [Opitutales bacterium]
MKERIIIYGGSGGVGASTARLLSRQGYSLHLVARSEERLAAISNDLGASYTVGDVTDPTLFDRVATQVEGAVKGLVYAVGNINLGGITRFKQDAFIEDFKINALGGALAVQSAIPAMRACEGTTSVVFFSSVAVQQGFKFHASIGMAKGAVEGLTRSLAAELAPSIRVNAIAPSLTRTPLASKIMSNVNSVKAFADSHPLKRLGEADDISAMAAFLLSEQSTWITGQIIGIDGGRSAISA